MESNLSNVRTGRITSSEIVCLTTFGAQKSRKMTEEELVAYKKENPKGRKENIDLPLGPGATFYSYVNDCIIERFVKQPVDDNAADVFAFAWGKLCERIVHNRLGFGYVFQSDVTLVHPKYPFWVGTPDGLKSGGIEYIEILEEHPNYKIVRANTVTDIKCPSSKKGFYNLVRDLYDFDGVTVTKKEVIDGDAIIQLIRERSKEGEKYYWQLVSNACIAEAEYAELIVFMPYYEELEEIKAYNINEFPEPFYSVNRRTIDELPYIDKSIGIDNINIIRFKVPQKDKDFLEPRVLLANDLIDAG